MNYVTPGYATAVFVSATGVAAHPHTAESHRRIAIIEVMGRHSGLHRPRRRATASRTSCSSPSTRSNVGRSGRADQGDLRPAEERRDRLRRGHRRREGPGTRGRACQSPTRPGNMILTGASGSPAGLLIRRLGRRLLHQQAAERVGAGPRSSLVKSGTPSAAAGRSCSTASTRPSSAATPWTCCSRAGERRRDPAVEPRQAGSTSASAYANDFRDRWGLIHARQMHPSFYDPVADAAEPDRASTTWCRSSRSAIGADDCRGDAERTVRPRQPDDAVPLGQHRREQADSISRLMPDVSSPVLGMIQLGRARKGRRSAENPMSDNPTSASRHFVATSRHAEDRAAVVAPVDLPEDGREAGRRASRPGSVVDILDRTASGSAAASTTATRASRCASSPRTRTSRSTRRSSPARSPPRSRSAATC